MDIPTESLHHPLAVSQPKAGASPFAAGMKTVENVRQVFFGNARSGIMKKEIVVWTLVLQANPDLAAGMTLEIVKSILQQVEKDKDKEGFVNAKGKRFTGIQMNSPALTLRIITILVERFPGDPCGGEIGKIVWVDRFFPDLAENHIDHLHTALHCHLPMRHSIIDAAE